MSSSFSRYSQFAIIYQKFFITQKADSTIFIEDYFFSSKILADLIQMNQQVIAYCIYPDSCVSGQDNFYDLMEKAENFLMTLADLNNPKFINPGVIFDWNLTDAEKILEMLEIKNVMYDKLRNVFIPYQTKIGFLFEAPFSYQGNCTYRKWDLKHSAKENV
jgi:hypothetical protein